jgi:hypothetical protein
MCRFSLACALVVVAGTACDGGLEPEAGSGPCPAGICGVVSFAGAVPESTDYVRVVVYRDFPTSIEQLTGFAGFSDPLPLGTDSARYRCCIFTLEPGSYAWVLVVWKKLGELNLTTAPDLLREIGSYLDASDTTRFGTVVVPASSGADGVNISADFGRMRSIADLFPPATASAPAPRPRPPARAPAAAPESHRVPGLDPGLAPV